MDFKNKSSYFSQEMPPPYEYNNLNYQPVLNQHSKINNYRASSSQALQPNQLQYQQAAVVAPKEQLNIIISYKIKFKGLFDDKIIYEDVNGGPNYTVETFLSGAKLLDCNKSILMKLKESKLKWSSLYKSSWNIVNLNNSIYNSIIMTKEDFEEEPVYIITMITKDNKKLEYVWYTNSELEASWRLTPKNQKDFIIMKYKVNMIHKNQLHIFCNVQQYDLFTFLITLAQLIIHRDEDVLIPKVSDFFE